MMESFLPWLSQRSTLVTLGAVGSLAVLYGISGGRRGRQITGFIVGSLALGGLVALGIVAIVLNSGAGGLP